MRILLKKLLLCAHVVLLRSYTVKVVDVFAMPQSGTGVSVEAVDDEFQTAMLEMLKQTGRPEVVVGWYHSHPGFGCWLSSVDCNTQQSFEQLNPRAVAVVVDPIQSVKGKVVIDAFRLINPQAVLTGQQTRQTTSNIGHLHKPSIQALIHGLNRNYYSLAINYRKNDLEQAMLMNLHKKKWTAGLTVDSFVDLEKSNTQLCEQLLKVGDRRKNILWGFFFFFEEKNLVRLPYCTTNQSLRSESKPRRKRRLLMLEKRIRKRKSAPTSNS